MQNPDDERFEQYLRQFRPVVPKSIPELSVANAGRPWHRHVAWVAAAAVVVIGIGTIALHYQTRFGVSDRSNTVRSTPSRTPAEAFTIRSANVWLTRAPSFNRAVDELSFRSGINPVEQGKQSAVAVLSKEKIKL